ncbi:hypothetical protein D9757_011905 [Collybiopsis confluens]|uniref:Major facilitator superfamily (MFS) profile domain-containing protein n=1 Tax=Collybiopsis confluens TaxID=2823264 RepID=A0A8H5GGJ7_9AGAR|nr:hypothetical protein D9757_011905 [Collybiopsis confluens]
MQGRAVARFNSSHIYNYNPPATSDRRSFQPALSWLSFLPLSFIRIYFLESSRGSRYTQFSGGRMANSKLRDGLIILSVSGVTTLNTFLSGALTVALPTVGKDLNFSESALQWPINTYNLAYGCTLLLFGRAGDIYGGRNMFLLGSAWFFIWSIATPFAPNPEAFTIFVALKGLGAAANTPAGIRIFVSHFPAGPSRNKAFGILGAGQPLGFILGLVLGGVLIQSSATWRAIFYFQAGLALFFVLCGVFCLDKDQNTLGRYTKGLDFGGAFLSTAGIALLSYALADVPSAPKGWVSPQILANLCISIVLLLAFWVYESWRESRGLAVLMPPSIWFDKSARMPAITSMVFFAWWSFNTLMYFATLYYQQVNLLSPLETSVRFIPMVISGIFANVVGGWLMNRVLGLPLMMTGLCGNIIAPILFATINVSGSYWLMAFWIMILIVGADVIYPVATIYISSNLDEESQSLAGGIFNVATRLGTSIGIGATSSIANSITTRYVHLHPSSSLTSPDALMYGFRAAGWTLAGAAIISFIIGVLFLRGIGVVGRREAKQSARGSEHSEHGKAQPDVDRAGLRPSRNHQSQSRSGVNTQDLELGQIGMEPRTMDGEGLGGGLNADGTGGNEKVTGEKVKEQKKSEDDESGSIDNGVETLSVFVYEV